MRKKEPEENCCAPDGRDSHAHFTHESQNREWTNKKVLKKWWKTDGGGGKICFHLFWWPCFLTREPWGIKKLARAGGSKKEMLGLSVRKASISSFSKTNYFQSNFQKVKMFLIFVGTAPLFSHDELAESKARHVISFSVDILLFWEDVVYLKFSRKTTSIHSFFSSFIFFSLLVFTGRKSV